MRKCLWYLDRYAVKSIKIIYWLPLGRGGSCLRQLIWGVMKGQQMFIIHFILNIFFTVDEGEKHL